MNGKKAKEIRKLFKGAKLSDTATYNVEGPQQYPNIETIYLTVDCKRFFTQKAKSEYKQMKRGR